VATLALRQCISPRPTILTCVTPMVEISALQHEIFFFVLPTTSFLRFAQLAQLSQSFFS
jgi:hypothetical protein